MGWEKKEEKLGGDGRHLLQRFFFFAKWARPHRLPLVGLCRCIASECRLTVAHCSGRFSYCSFLWCRSIFLFFFYFIFCPCQFVALPFSWARWGVNPAEKRKKNLKP
jgi:hypothetical protein